MEGHHHINPVLFLHAYRKAVGFNHTDVATISTYFISSDTSTENFSFIRGNSLWVQKKSSLTQTSSSSFILLAFSEIWWLKESNKANCITEK